MAKGKKTGGRKKGTPNRLASDLRQMILGALADAGGREYLERQAEKAPSAFLALVGKLISAQSRSKDAGPIETPEMSDLEVARRLAFLLARGAQALEAARAWRLANSTGQDVLGLPVRLKR
jgi:hypothetical protein